jgi:pyoverdine/dityrosine biosynthesis protein Dit1
MFALQSWPSQTEKTVESIYGLLLQRANAVDARGPVKGAAAAAAIRGKIQKAVQAGRPFEMVLPAFPAKSPNPEKTLGHLPDYGEVLALRELNTLCRSIQECYAPGARIVICSDGRVFSDLVKVSDDQVNEYGRGIEEIVELWGLSNLATFNLDDVFSGFEFDRMRRELVDGFATPVEEIRRRTREDEAHKSLFNGIHRFIFEDRVVLESGKSRSRVREEAKGVAYEVIQRSNAWGELVQKHFPDAVRLSIHPQGPDSEKLGVKLLPSRNIWRTPWHGVVVGTDGHFELSTRRAAVEAGAVLAQAAGGYGYFMVQP